MGTFFCLGAGNYGAHTTLIHWGGYLGLAAAACAFYLALAELCEFSYGRSRASGLAAGRSVTSGTHDVRRLTGSKEALVGGYDQTYRQWQNDPEEFWRAASTAIDWDRPPDAILDRSVTPSPAWFPGGELNTCFNALDRHVRDGRGEQAALIYDSPVTGAVRRYSYRELLDEVARFAGALTHEGVGRGDRVVIYMPMVPEAVIAMLACARLGAIHSVVFGGFGADELAARIADSGARMVVCASCGIAPGGVTPYKPLVDRALELLDGQQVRCIVLQRPEGPGLDQPGRDIEWDDVHRRGCAGAVRAGRGHRPAVHPLHVGDHRPAEGHRARQRRPRRRAGVVDGGDLRRAPGRGVLGCVGHRLGRRPFLHRLRAAATRMHDRPLRGQAGRDA